jgi:prophage antirepressor-like protein
MSSLINVYENLLKYNDKEVFIILDINNEIWFKLKDIFKLLGYINSRKAVQEAQVNNKYKKKYKYIKVYPSEGTPLNAQPTSIFVNEAGLYQLLYNSHKPLAEKFRNELFMEILPTIRKTGAYKMKEKDNNKLKEINNKLKTKIKKLEEENNYYEDKHVYKPKQNSYIYIVKKKIGYTDDIEKRMKVYKTGKSNIMMVYHIPIIFDGKQTEDCIKSINKLHKMKSKTDDLCYLSLAQLKTSIIDCISILKNHICKCNLCKKKFKFNKIDKHSCD